MWDERFSMPGYLFGTEPAAFLAAHAEYLKPGLSALAVADGEGRNSVFMAEHGVEVTAMDASAVAVEKAILLARERGVNVGWHIGDVADWNWAGAQYDLVVGIFIQFMVPSLRAKVFAGMVEALKPGGYLMLHGYRPEQLELGTGGPPRAEMLYTEDLLREAFADLEIVELHSYDRDITEGTAHSGMSALIDLVARKPA